MPEARTDRTNYLGLLALMMVAADTQDWSYPYWNIQQIDAALYALAQGPRDGTAIAAPDTAPTASVLASGGSLSGGLSLEVVQTFVDVFGRETLAGPACALSTGAGMSDPLAAPTLTDPTNAGSGYEGGLLQAWYTWVDSAGGETLASPECDLDLPYLTGGLYTQVTFSLPCTAASVGATGANVYICQRGGNIVLAKRILSSSATTCTLDANVVDCYRSLPVANSTNGNKAVVISAGATAPTGVAYTRFYVRPATQAWTAGDCRVKVAGVDQWAPDSVPYPITYAGLLTDLAPGFPPSVSQVKSFRPIDLTSEVTGLLPADRLAVGAGGGGDLSLCREIITLTSLGRIDSECLWHARHAGALVSNFVAGSNSVGTADGVVAGMTAGAGAGLTVVVASGTACLYEDVEDYGGGTIEVPDNATTRIWWDGSDVQSGADWPTDPHAALCTAVTASGVVTGVTDNRNDLSALNAANHQLLFDHGFTRRWQSVTVQIPAGIRRLLGYWVAAPGAPDPADYTLTVHADYGSGDGSDLICGTSGGDLGAYTPDGPTQLTLVVTCVNNSPDSDLQIDTLGVIWEETT